MVSGDNNILFVIQTDRLTRSHKPFDTDARLLTIYNLSGGDVGVLALGLFVVHRTR